MFKIDLFNIGLDKFELHNIAIDSNNNIKLSYDNYLALAINNSSSSYTNEIVKLNINDDHFNVFTDAGSTGKNAIRFYEDNDYITELKYNITSWDSILNTATIYIQIPSIPSNSAYNFYFNIDQNRTTDNSDTSLSYTEHNIYVTYGITYMNSGYILSPIIDLYSTTYGNIIWNQIINNDTGIGNMQTQQIQYITSNIQPTTQYSGTFVDSTNIEHKYWLPNIGWGNTNPEIIDITNNYNLQLKRYLQLKITLLSPLDNIVDASRFLWNQSKWDNGIWV